MEGARRRTEKRPGSFHRRVAVGPAPARPKVLKIEEAQQPENPPAACS